MLQRLFFFITESDYSPKSNKNGKIVEVILIRRKPQTRKKSVNPGGDEPKLPGEKRMLLCPECPYSTVRTDRYREHRRTHTKEKPLACKSCSYRTAYPSCLRKHVLRHAKTLDHKCSECHKQFRMKNQLAYHMIRTHNVGIKPHNCQECEISFLKPAELRRHLATKHQTVKPFQCPLCTYKGKTKTYLKQHMSTHKPKDACKCKFCPFSCRHQSGMIRHVFTFHKEKPGDDGSKTKKHECIVCSEKFPTKDLEIKHRSVHVGQPHKCNVPKCSAVFAEYFYLKRHKEVIHPNPDRLECPICSYVAVDLEELEEHDVIVHNKIHKCRFCGKSFSKKQSYRKHVEKTHVTETLLDDPTLEDGSVICVFCFSTYPDPVKLQEHSQNCHLHPNNSLNCPKCDFKTLYPHELVTHKTKSHGYNFTFKKSVKVHNCDVCNQDFNSKRDFLAHVFDCPGNVGSVPETGLTIKTEIKDDSICEDHFNSPDNVTTFFQKKQDDQTAKIMKKKNTQDVIDTNLRSKRKKFKVFDNDFEYSL